MKYKVSIIIPCYNCENTIQKTIKSIINQTIQFENIELIIVDDCSTDKSQDIILNYSLKYSNIKHIFLEKNSGFPSKPRNIGIDQVTAPFLMFIDADDTILNDYCETLYNTITYENADVVNSKLAYQFFKGIYASSNFSKKYIELEDRLSAPLNMCGNIFRTDFIKKNKIYCPNAYAEDSNFSVKAYTQAKKMIQMPNYYGYFYRIETDGKKSITHNINFNTIDKTINGYNLIKSYLDENNLDKDKVFNIRIVYLLLTFFKFKGLKKDKLKMLKRIRNFELSLNYSIVINSKLLSIVNNLVIQEHYNIVIILGFFANKIYKQKKLRNFVYFKFFGLKKLELTDD